MTIKAFKATLAALGGKIESEEPYNTNNAWGFGGMVGTRFKATLDGMTLFFDHGQLCYRHLAPEHEDHVHIEDAKNKPFTAPLFFKLHEAGARTFEQFKTMYEQRNP